MADLVADMLADMLDDIVADMKVDKVADMFFCFVFFGGLHFASGRSPGPNNSCLQK